MQYARPFAILAILMISGHAATAQDAEAGKAAFKPCLPCHEAETERNKVGPHLKGVVGRRAASVQGYNYSPAMKKAGEEGLVWDEATLAKYLADPKATVPGTKMVFPGMKDPTAVQNVIAYLKSVSG